MAYNINLTNGQTLVTIPDGQQDTSYSSLVLFGKNSSNYGEFQNENVVHLLENFANVTAPANPLQGQLWWDTTNKRLNIRTATQWKTVSGPTAAATEPANPVVGDQWWDTDNAQLKVFNGTGWSLIGPLYTSHQQMSGPIVTNVVGTDGLARVVVIHYVANVLVAIMSKEPTFNINSIVGFSSISPGINLPTGSRYYGDANNALSLGGVLAANYLRGDVASTATQPLTIQNNTGLTVGASNNLNIGFNTANNESRIDGTIDGQSIALRVNRAGVMTQAMKVDGTTGLVTVADHPVTELGVSTKGYVDNTSNYLQDILASKTYVNTAIADNTTQQDIYLASKEYVDQHIDTALTNLSSTPTNGLVVNGLITTETDNQVDIGTPVNRFRRLYSTATTAYYADLAENYVADAPYEPGTVLQFGGEEEVTLCNRYHSMQVAGVVSTNPAYLMNGHCEGKYIVALALQGRVPCKVRGNIRKGDVMVSGDDGFAVATIAPAAGTIIGKALEDFNGEYGIIEVSVGRC